MRYFWTNSFWYLLLGAITICELAFVLVKAKNRKFTFAYYLTLCGIEILFFETFVFLIFRGYDYFPKIIQSSPFDDNLLGKVFSQVSVCATVLMVAVLNLNIFWIILLSAAYGLIEEFFLFLNIYHHHWYRTWYTVIVLIFSFWIFQKYYIKLLNGKRPFMHYFNVFTGLFPMTVLTILWAFSLAGVQRYTFGISPDPDIDKAFSANLYFILLAVPMMLIYFLRLKRLWKLAAMFILNGMNYILYKMNYLSFKSSWWFLFFSVSTVVWIYFSIVLLDHMYQLHAKPGSGQENKPGAPEGMHRL